MSELINWVVGWAQSPAGATALFFLAFAESSFFPVPPDVLLIAMAILRPEEAFWLALICSAGSILGGVLGFYLGWLGGRPLLNRFFSQEKIHAVKKAFEKYEVWAIAIAGFTPIPYKVFTISAGTFDIPFRPFLAASAVSRSARFFLVSSVIYLWGETMKLFLEKYFNWLTLAFVILLVGGFFAVKPILNRHQKSPRLQVPDQD